MRVSCGRTSGRCWRCRLPARVVWSDSWCPSASALRLSGVRGSVAFGALYTAEDTWFFPRCLPVGVSRHAPPKRGRAAAGETAQEFRRHKSATEEAFAELVCPITFSLPVDPVKAEDGNVYERSAIEEWLKKQLKSPVTNLAMGTKLLPALRVKNMIRAMVASGALTGDKVDAWKLKLEEEEEVAEMLRKAEAGDGTAMYNLGLWYELGKKGLAKDEAKAFECFKKSHEAGNASGTVAASASAT